MKTLKDIQHLEGVKVLVRVDFNVPLKKGSVTDDFRIKVALPTINFLRAGGAKIILITHVESIDGTNPSIEPEAEALKKLGVPVTFVKDIRKAAHHVESMPNGECVLLDNLRFFEGEKNNDQAFAKELASLADIYVNEAFPVSHREHASIVSVPKYLPSYGGIQLEKEITYLSHAFTPPHPSLFVLGGAKFETKLPLLRKFMDSADTVFVAGALASDFYRAQGYKVGKSLVSKGTMDLKDMLANPKLILPVDIMNEESEIKPAGTLGAEDKIVDAGPKTLESIREKVTSMKFILWNGPLGMYEDGYMSATLELAKMIGEATARGAETIAGGGDTLAAIDALGIQDKFTFLSTGGGAMLDFLAKGTLPGIEALNSSKE